MTNSIEDKSAPKTVMVAGEPTLDGNTLAEWKTQFWNVIAQRDQWIAWGWAMLEQAKMKHFRPDQSGQRALLSSLIRKTASLDIESRLIKLAAALVQGSDFISDVPGDHSKSVPRNIIKAAARQREQLRRWAIEAREIADALRDRRSVASSTQDGLTVESLRSELRQLFPDVQIIVDIRDCGTETQTLRGTTLEYGAQIGMNGNEFVGDSLAQVLAAVRAWKAKGGTR